MARQSDAQKKVIDRVMHEYKHGELATSTGKKVKSRRQAIAIGLSEAGASNQQSPAENRKRLKDTKARERKGQTARRTDERNGPTRAELYEKARKKNVAGRSKMSKAELARAVKG